MTTTLISWRSGSKKWNSCGGRGFSDMKNCQSRLVYGLQLLARLEPHSFSGRDIHFGPGTGIAADAGLARAHIKNPKAAQFNAFALGQRFLHAFEYGLHRHLGFGFSDAGLGYYFVDDVELNHLAAPRKCTEEAVLGKEA